MQLHKLPKNKMRKRKRVGRGGKRGSYSGKGMKGQKSRAGHKPRAGFRGGDNPIWKLFPKQRGSTKRVDVKHRKFYVRRDRPAAINLSVLDGAFENGATVSIAELVAKELVIPTRAGVKILGTGEISKKLVIENIPLSKSAAEKIVKAGGTINTK